MTRLLLILALLVSPVLVQAQTPTYERLYEVRTNGNDSTYQQGLTHRYVNGELRFLNVALNGTIHEFRLLDSGVQTATTATWTVPGGVLNNFSGIWWEAAKGRLWITSAEDYTANYQAAKVTILTLGNGSASIQKQFFLNVPAKRVYGGCNAVPAALVSRLGGPYVCGWGGYTSLVQQGGNASIGPTMYAIPDPDTIADGSTVTVRTVLDAVNQRGVRKTIPQNYFDGGDPRPNPPTRPTAPVSSAGQWLSPNADGLGWMVWGDSYYNTGVWIGDTFALVASLCKGSCWYQSSDLHYDGRQYELHTWAGSSLGSNILQRPSTMTELTPPKGNTRVWEGNRPVGNIGGATYDATTGKLWMIGYPFGTDDYTGRLYRYGIGAGVPPVDPPPTPVDCVVSAYGPWSIWQIATATTETRNRFRQVITPASNGGAVCPALIETETRQVIVVPPAEPVYTLVDVMELLNEIQDALVPVPLSFASCTVTSTTTDTITIRRSSCGLARPTNGSVLRVLR